MPQGGAGGMPNGQAAGGYPAAMMPASAGGAPNWQSYFSGLAQQQPGLATFGQAAASPPGSALFQAPQVAMPDFSAWQPTQQGAVPAQGTPQQASMPDLGQMLAQINQQKQADAMAAFQAAQTAQGTQQLQQIGFQPAGNHDGG